MKTFVIKDERLSTSEVLMWVKLSPLTWLCVGMDGDFAVEHVDRFYGRNWEPCSLSFDVFESAR